MLVTVNDNQAGNAVLQEVNTDHVVNIATPNMNNPDMVTISLSNGRQITTNAAGADALREAMCSYPPALPAGDDVVPAEAASGLPEESNVGC